MRRFCARCLPKCEIEIRGLFEAPTVEGLVKYLDSEEEETTYYDLDDTQLAMIAADPDVEIVEHTVKDAPGAAIDTKSTSEAHRGPQVARR
jgi:hypothetical protein